MRWRLALLCWVAAAHLCAADGGRVSLVLDAQPAQTALALARQLGAGDHQREPGELTRTAAERPLTACLVQASPDGLRQALAHAQDCWWVADGDRTTYTNRATPPLGPVESRTCTSGLIRLPGIEDHLRTLLAPWLADPSCGLSYLPDEGLWSATLDRAGHARLVEAITIIERTPAVCPPLLADPDHPGPDCRLDRPLVVAGWSDLTRKLAPAVGVSIACSAELPPAPSTSTLRPGTLSEVITQLEQLGLRCAIIRGVLCIGREPPRERWHPALRRRLAQLPVGHVVHSDAEGQLLVSIIKAKVEPWWWSLSGASLSYLSDRRSLLVAADPAVLHAIVDALDRADLLGLDQAFGAGR